MAASLVASYLVGSGWGGLFADLAEQVGAWGYAPRAPRPTALLTHLAVHASSLHLVGNLLLVLTFGPNVERRLGPARFALAFLACGAAGALVFAAAAPEETLPLVGASAAALGLGALHALALRGQRILVCIWVLVVWVGELPAWVLLACFAALDLLAVFVTGFGGGRVAVPAHLGGLALGTVLGLVARARRAQPES